MAEHADWITWTKNDRGSEVGKAGGLTLFTISYGLTRQDNMYALSTGLPVKHSSLGQVHPTPTHAKVATEKLLRAFVAKITPTEET